MSFIQNWPEGLFILLVLAMPLMIAAWQAQSLGSFLTFLGGCMGVGLICWAGMIWVLGRAYSR
jgi:hypothetical protein